MYTTFELLTAILENLYVIKYHLDKLQNDIKQREGAAE